MTTNRAAIPGFTATAALEVAHESTTSRPAGPVVTGTGAAAVVPQARHLDMECFVTCLSWGGSRQSCFRGCSYELPM
jgi:hypothetical protein